MSPVKKGEIRGCRAFSRGIEKSGDARCEMAPGGASLIILSVGCILSRTRKRIPVPCNEVDARGIKRSEGKKKLSPGTGIRREVHIDKGNGMAGYQSSNLEQAAIMRRSKSNQVRAP